MATKKAQVTTLEKRFNSIKKSAGNLNETAIETADYIVEETLATGAQWQKLFAKVLKRGTEILEKQQDFTFETLENLKGQYQDGSLRFRKLMDLDRTKRINKTAKKAVKKATNKVDEILEAATTKTTTPKKRKSVVKAKASVKRAASAIRKSSAKKVVKKTKADDLKVIEGIGPKIATILNKAGIKSFDQLAKTNVKSLREILTNAGPRYKAHNPSTWKRQASLAAKGQWAKLTQLQGELMGGKVVKK